MRRIGVLLLIAAVSATASAALIHQYTFDDGTANDSVGSFNLDVWNAGVSGGTLNTVGVISSAYGDVSGLVQNSFTFEAWVAGSWVEDVFGIRGGNLGDGSPDWSSGLVVRHNTWDGVFVLTSDNGWGTNWVPSYRYVNGDGKHQIVMAYTRAVGDDLIDLYVDGDYIGSTTTAVEFPATSILRIGGDAQWTEAQYDVFNIYDSALTASEVAANYAAGIPEPATMMLLGLGGLALRFGKR